MGKAIRSKSLEMPESNHPINNVNGTTATTVQDITSPRILLVSPLPPPEGGIASWTNRILSSEAMEKEDLYHLDTSLSTGHFLLKVSSPAKVLKSLILIAKFFWMCLKLRPDIVHITSGGFGKYSDETGYSGSYFTGFYRDALYIFIARLLRAKIVLHLHLGDMENFVEAVPKLIKPLVNISLRSCTYVAAITKPVAEVVRRVGCKRVEVVPNCIDIYDAPLQRPADDSKDELKVLYLGWVLPAKGVSDLIEAVATIDGISLTIIGPRIESADVGNASWLDSALSSPGALAKVTMSGPVDSESARAAYLEHDIFVLPSHREGFPNVVLEAMDAAMPIIATRVGAIPEMIVDGEHGLLIDASDVSALSEKLIWMRDHAQERLAMGNAARIRVEELYSVGRVVSLWKDLYRRAALGI